PGALTKCIRILILWNTEKAQNEIKHAYMNGAAKLRPDLSTANT
ncbi:MAG: chorismate mutase, partial [Chloroflexi bacterium]|nr:chorismate mutase [Chloroflexota bacterium]